MGRLPLEDGGRQSRLQGRGVCDEKWVAGERHQYLPDGIMGGLGAHEVAIHDVIEELRDVPQVQEPRGRVFRQFPRLKVTQQAFLGFGHEISLPDERMLIAVAAEAIVEIYPPGARACPTSSGNV